MGDGQPERHRSRWLDVAVRVGSYDLDNTHQVPGESSLPPFLLREVLLPYLERGGRAVILAEEWHTADAVLHLDWLLRNAKLRERATMFWNVNNTFSLERIAWERLNAAAVITTVSRYMKHLLWERGVNPLVIPNGLTADAFVPPERETLAAFREVVPVHRLAYSFGWEGSDEVPPGSSLVEIDLIDQHGGTLVRLTQSGLPDAEECASHEEGWTHYLERLSVAAAGGDPGPDTH